MDGASGARERGEGGRDNIGRETSREVPLGGHWPVHSAQNNPQCGSFPRLILWHYK